MYLHLSRNFYLRPYQNSYLPTTTFLKCSTFSNVSIIETIVDVHQALYKIVSCTKTNSFLRTSICYEYFISLVPKPKRTKPKVWVPNSLLSGSRFATEYRKGLHLAPMLCTSKCLKFISAFYVRVLKFPENSHPRFRPRKG